MIETPLFQKQCPAYWTEDQRGEFASFLADHPDAGDVVLLTLYAKARTGNLSAAILKEILRALET